MTRVSPNQPKTPLHSFRCDDDLWNAAKGRARQHDETIADVLRRALHEYMVDGQCRVCGNPARAGRDLCPTCAEKLQEAELTVPVEVEVSRTS